MTRTRTAALSLALVLLGPLAAAGCVTGAPPSTRLTSPVVGWTSLSASGQEALVETCSLAGGPVSVSILDVEDQPGSSLSAAATITLGTQPFDGTPVRLTAVGDSWVSQPLPANSCFLVRVYDNYTYGHIPVNFKYSVAW